MDSESFSDEEEQSFSNESIDEEKQDKQMIDEIDEDKVQGYMKTYWEKFQQLDPLKYFKFPQSKNVARNVCAKVISRTQIIIQCYDCQMDDTCVICMQCFKNGDHEGHRYVAKAAGGGCCDCGDIEAWSEKGFCKNHSGQFKNFTIDTNIQKQFNDIIDGLFYKYFSLTIKKNSKSEEYCKKLITLLTKLNSQNLYYNKLTFEAINRPLQSPYSLNEVYSARTILENMFTFSISGTSIDDWFHFYIQLFPYYPSKLAILTHYMKNQDLLSGGIKKGIQCCRSISCQILTSYKVVQEYALKNKMGLGQNIKVPTSNQNLLYQTIYIISDLKYISQLKEGVPLIYWKMHINTGFNVIFEYSDVLKEKAQKMEDKESSSFLKATLVGFAQVQHFLLELMADIVGIVKQDPQLLLQLIKILYNKAKKQKQSKLTLYRPYQRCLGIALFGYYELSLQTMNEKKFAILLKTLQVDEHQFRLDCHKMLKRMFDTYFEYSRSLMQPGYRSSLYNYFHNYKVRDRLMAVADIITIKVLMLVADLQPAVNLQAKIEQIVVHQGQDELEVKKKQTCLQILLKEINLFYVSKSYQIYEAYSIKKQNKKYEHEIQLMFLMILKQSKGTIKLQDYDMIKNHIFHPSSNIDSVVKKFTQFRKDKKQFVCNTDIPGEGINFNNFRVNFEKGDNFQNHQKTLNLIQGYNRKIFRKFWNEESVKKFIKLFVKLQGQGGSKNESIHKAILSQAITITLILKEFQFPEHELLLKVILQNEQNKKLIPSEIAEKLSIKVQQVSIIEEVQSPLKLQKQKTKENKMKKMKQKQKAFIEKVNIKQNQVSSDEEIIKEKEVCCICRNDKSSQFVYPVNISIRNHQKLLGMGNGVDCISFSSCNHVFDYNCIYKNMSHSKVQNSLICPLCRAPANNLLPVNPHEQVQKRFMDRFIQIIFSYKSNLNCYEQMIKCFYHFVLLSTVDLENCFAKRLKVYRLLLRYLKKQIPKKELDELYERFKTQRLKIVYEKEPEKQKKSGLFSSILSLIRNSSAEGQTFQLNHDQIQQQASEFHAPQLFKIKTKQQKKKEKAKKQKVQNFQYSTLFYATMNSIFKILRDEQESEEEMINPILQICLKALKDHQFPSNIEYNYPKTQKVLKELPLKYEPLGKIRKCSQCGQISENLMLCLICHWVGCQNCQNGKIQKHTSEKHGQISALMYVQNCKTCYIINSRIFMTGCLYQDEWGRSMQSNKEWNKYELNIPLLTKIDNALRLDEIEKRKSDF